MNFINDYEAIIGLEVHVELKTKTKIFCSCKTDFGAEPNTQCCPVCLGMPGTLPTLNKEVPKLATKVGLALNCQIANISFFDRKNYFYPDLPKAYQISQSDVPLCSNGKVTISTDDGEKSIGITRIHMEEDAGKLLHDASDHTLIDCNRCGIPLIEIVTEPDLRSDTDAVAFLKKLRNIIVFTGASECKMNEGGMRCDVNISVRKKGCSVLGTRTEIKNINSFAFVAKAIESEYRRQVSVLEQGGKITQDTLRFDSDTCQTHVMRTKENAADYRFFREPDLPPLILSDDEISEIAKTLPLLPDKRIALYTEKYGLSRYDATVLCDDIRYALLFESSLTFTAYPKTLANLLITELPRLFSDDGKCLIEPKHLAQAAELLGSEKVNSTVAKKALLNAIENGVSPENYVSENDLAQINDIQLLQSIAECVLSENTKLVSDYLSGKNAAIKAIIGLCMKQTRGKADPVKLTEIIKNELSKLSN